MEIVKGNIGPEASYEVKTDEGSLVVEAAYVGADSSAKFQFKHNFATLIDKGAALIKKAIPGSYEDAIVDGVAATLKSAIK